MSTAQRLLERLPDALDPARAADLRAVVQYELATPVHHVFDGGRVRTVAGRAEAPDVTLTVSDDDLVALVRGDLAPAVALFSGRMRVAGDLGLAQRLLDAVDRERLMSGSGSDG